MLRSTARAPPKHGHEATGLPGLRSKLPGVVSKARPPKRHRPPTGLPSESGLQPGAPMLFRLVALWFLLAFPAHAEPINANDISVVDGDTIDVQGSRYRMVGYDTPEISTPRRKVSPGEMSLAVIAKERFSELLRSGSLDL